MKDSEQTKNWYKSIAATYKSGYLSPVTSEARKNWYSQVADAYNKTRPSYPQQLITRAVELAKLPSDAILLEIGCGPGTATVTFAKLGFSMICLEPSQKACQLAQENCTPYPKIEIVNTTFEEWNLEIERFDAVLAATSFHWVSPEIGYAKAAGALKDKGYLIFLWNLTPQPDYEVYQLLHEVYQTHAPSLARYEDRESQEKSLINTGKPMIESGYFQDLLSEHISCKVTYSIDDYLALLSTLSPYIALEDKQRDRLFAGLREKLERHCGKTIEISYISAFHIAQKQ
ncbi:class I SAM-dependent methyltransferase [Limnofasciculus baicalensis]|uniref:Methyltransferase domain-containing protein n=1 Tax=Limnofasciculus baicalensis BBK-W-15 TaxID=2699891 RepID=A0AAE3KPJ6_9CYAN|nr:methyltransferase domain-containing protein [Limnofasciculus baicalensis]MCP2731414.1 methyltransferase domain-containing protein [Limnofasciculus baicalensis BBK-W-15]